MSHPPFYEQPDGRWFDDVSSRWMPGPSPRAQAAIEQAPESSERVRILQIILAGVMFVGALLSDIDMVSVQAVPILGVIAYLATGRAPSEFISRR